MASTLRFNIKGEKQGLFMNDAQAKNHQDDKGNAKKWISGLAFEYGLVSPRDLATGQSSGRRQHQPVKVVMEWGPWTPQIFTASVQNENLTEVNFEFWHTGVGGVDYVYYAITLKKAKVSSIRFVHDDLAAKTGKVGDFSKPEVVEVMFTFSEINMENKDGKTMAADDWMTGTGG